MSTTITNDEVGEDRFDVDLIMERALAADEADIAAHGRVQQTMADVVATAYRAFEIGVWEMTHDRFTEAVPWLATAVDSGIEEARPLLEICVRASDPIPHRRAAAADEHDAHLAEQLVVLAEETAPAEDAPVRATPIYEEVLALAHAFSARPEPSRWVAPTLLLPGRALEHRCLADLHGAPERARLEYERLRVTHERLMTITVPELREDLLVLNGTWSRQTVLEPDAVSADRCLEWTVLQLKWRPEHTSTTGPFPQRIVLPSTSARPAADRPVPSPGHLRRQDFDLLARDAGEGNPEAVHALLELIQPVVVRYCRARIGGRDLAYITADDIAQEVCLSVLKALPDYAERGGSFLYLVHAIAANKVTDAFRAIARNRAEPVRELPGGPVLGQTPGSPVLRMDDLGARLGRMLAHLPRRQQEVLVLRIAVGLSATETGEALGVSPGNVRVTQHRALVRLRTMLREEEF